MIESETGRTTARIRIVGIGAGGHALSVLDALLSRDDWTIVGLTDADVDRHGRLVLGCPVLGPDAVLPELLERGVTHAFIGVGGASNNRPRATIFARLIALGFVLPPIVHRTAIVAPSATLGAGAQIMAGAIVNALATIGQNAIVNTGSIVEHECRIGDHVHIGPGARLGGAVTVGESAHIGIGATVRQGQTIGSRAIVAAGAVVVSDVPPDITFAGVPARMLRSDREPGAGC